MTHVTLAISIDVPMYCAGVEATLKSAGFLVEAPPDPGDWARRKGTRGERAVLLTLLTPSSNLIEVERLSRYRSVCVVALLRPVIPSLYLGAVSAGATGAVDWSAQRHEMVRAIEAALDGQALIPTSVLRDLARGHGPWLPSDEQRECLRRLAEGETVGSIGRALHHSEREMFRRLKGLYGDLGAAGRQDAIGRAIHLGLLDASALASGVA